MSINSIKLNGTIGNISDKRISNTSITSFSQYITDNTTWSRPSDWMPLPDISGGPDRKSVV